MQMYLVSRCDFNHRLDSMELIAVAEKDQVIGLIEQDCLKRGETLSKESIKQLGNIEQTQGHAGDYEYYIDQVIVNELI